MTYSDHLYSHFHIPKSAGTSLMDNMLTAFGKDSLLKTVVIKNALKRSFKKNKLYDNYTTLSDEDRSKIKLIFGYTNPFIDNSFEHRKLMRIIILRNPLERILSHYNFLINIGWISRNYRFEYFHKQIKPNYISLSLLNRYLGFNYASILFSNNQQLYDSIGELLSKFWFVGDIKYTDELIYTIFDLHNLNNKPHRTNITERKTMLIEDIPESIINDSKLDHYLDYKIFDAWSNRKFDNNNIIDQEINEYILMEMQWDKYINALYYKSYRRIRDRIDR